MAVWKESYETDAVCLFVRDRSIQRMAEASRERLARQIRLLAAPDQSAYQHHRWQHLHLPTPHLTH